MTSGECGRCPYNTLRLQLMISGLSRQQITKPESVTPHGFPPLELNPLGEDRTVEHEGMKLPVFSAGINAGGEALQELGIEQLPGKALIQVS